MASRITLLGTVTEILPSDNDKKVVATIQPEAEKAPPIIVSAYGNLGAKLTELVGSPSVVHGQFTPIVNEKGSWTMGSFSINADELYVSSPWGESAVLVNIVGKYSDRYAEFAQGDSWAKYSFGISHSFFPKKEDGKYPYANWKIAKFGSSQDELENRFKRFLRDGDLLEATVSLSWYEKKDGGFGLNANLKSHSFLGGGSRD
jgi:hypothetical protein